MRTLRSFMRVGRTVAAAATLVVGIARPDIALACSATIGDFVWLDSNNNGIQDAGEPGIANVRVSLWLDGVEVKAVLTDQNGYYSFTGKTPIDPGCEKDYVVKAETPAGFVPTQLYIGGNSLVDSNDPAGSPVNTHDYGPPINEWGVVSDLSIDFGFVPPPVVCTGQIGDFVWNDLNNNGRQDDGEPGIAASTVTLNGGSAQATGSGGGYLFTALCAGTYTVCADTPVGFQPSPANADGVPASLNSDGTSNGNQSCASVTLIGDSASDVTIDFGFWQLPHQSPGTGTPGYWKTHPEAWPVDSITIGGVVYTKDQALYYMGLPDGDKTVTLFRALVSAKLNVLIGNDASCIAGTISAADAWMASNGPVGSGVKARTLAWKSGEPLYWELDAYNNGDRCAPHRQ